MSVTVLLIFCLLASPDDCVLIDPGYEQVRSVTECLVIGSEIAAIYAAEHPAWSEVRKLRTIRCIIWRDKPATEAGNDKT